VGGGIIDAPVCGAHRKVAMLADTLKAALAEELQKLKSLPVDELLAQRYNKFMAMGAL